MEINSLAALVSQQSSDLELYAGFVFAALDGALPAGYLNVERHRSMSDRMRGKEATVIGVSVRLGQDTVAAPVLSP
jgi:hypothetical protein